MSKALNAASPQREEKADIAQTGTGCRLQATRDEEMAGLVYDSGSFAIPQSVRPDRDQRIYPRRPARGDVARQSGSA